MRFDRGGAVIVGRWGHDPGTVLPSGLSFELGGGGALSLVRNTGLPARFDEYAYSQGDMGETVRPVGLRASAAAPVSVENAIWGALVVSAFDGEALPEDAEERLTAFAGLASLAIAGADAHERLLESRARLVRTADDERRRLERNLHDGAQQRLVSARLALRMLRNQVAGHGRRGRDPRRARARPTRSCASSPADCTRRRSSAGWPPRSARSRPAPRVPVEYDVVEQRFPDELEVAVYYVASEALTNAAKHAEASVVRVTRGGRGRRLVLEVADDGRGGARQGEGSGLVGLDDRVEALRGRLRITSPPGVGTTVRAEFPLP